MILSILAVFATSTLSTKSGGQITHARMVGDLAILARQNAISKNAVTALVVAEVSSGGLLRSAASIWDAQTTNQLEKWNLLQNLSGLLILRDLLRIPFVGARFRGQALSNSVAYWFYPDGAWETIPVWCRNSPCRRDKAEDQTPANWCSIRQSAPSRQSGPKK